jgi:Lrp/AsnC ligand binding domain
MRVVATDLDDYATLRDHKLATLPGVQRITSTIVMKRIVDNRPLPRLRLSHRFHPRTTAPRATEDRRPSLSAQQGRAPAGSFRSRLAGRRTGRRRWRA